MNHAQFLASLESARILVTRLGLLKQRGVKEVWRMGVSQDFKHASQRLDYFATFKTALQNFDYDILLFDDSFFQFEFTPSAARDEIPEARYAFFQNPREFRSYEEYLIDNGFALVEVGDEFREEYEQFMIEQQVSMNAVTFRFDCDPQNYERGVHSASHLHVGYGGDVRIPLNLVISPEKFVLFVLRQGYFSRWSDWIRMDNAEIRASRESNRNGCIPLQAKFWHRSEHLDLFIA